MLSRSGNPELSDCGDIKRTQVLPMDVVRFNNLACADHNMSRAFCEDSGWGDGEATVVCRNEMYSKYGFGGKQVANYMYIYKYSNSANKLIIHVYTLF